MFETARALMPAWLTKLALANDPMDAGNGHGAPEDWGARLAGAPEGQRRHAALQVAGHYLALGIAPSEVEEILLGFALRCKPAFPEGEVRELVRDLARRDRAKDDASRPAGVGRQALIIPGSTIQPEAVRWLWPGRIGVGALTNAVGLPDQGKTLIFCDVTARISIGSPMPPEAKRSGIVAPQRVLILTIEDSLSMTIVPRLIRAGADLEMVDFVQMVRNATGATSLLTLAEDLDVLADAFRSWQYALVIVDGITGYLGNAKTHNDAEVRQVLAPFAELLSRAGVAGLSVMHPPKSIANLAYYAGGSIAFSTVPRVTLAIAPDPGDDNPNPRRLLIKTKGNLYGAVPTLGYRIRADGPTAVPWIEWDPHPVTVNIADALDPLKENAAQRGSRHTCAEWLRSYLADGPRGCRDVEMAAQAQGFSLATLRRAREGLVDSVKSGGPHGRQQWEWTLR
jgi:hypothetical protein